MNLRDDLKLMAEWVPEKSKVLDLGCGDGELLKYLINVKNVHGCGVDIDIENVLKCLECGVNIIQADLESGLPTFSPNSFDVVILSQTIQSIRDIPTVLNEMLSVARQAIVSFPNFGFWKNRLQILKGKMPVSETIPFSWFNTPNIHLCTLKDFEYLCRDNNISIVERIIYDKDRKINFLPNLLGSLALYRIQK